MKQLEVSLGTGFAAAGCRACGRVFTTVRGFDMHQRLTRQGVVCLDPATVGLERKKSGRWGRKASEAQQARVAQFNAAENISGTFSAPPVSSVPVAC